MEYFTGSFERPEARRRCWPDENAVMTVVCDKPRICYHLTVLKDVKQWVFDRNRSEGGIGKSASIVQLNVETKIRDCKQMLYSQKQLFSLNVSQMQTYLFA